MEITVGIILMIKRSFRNARDGPDAIFFRAYYTDQIDISCLTILDVYVCVCIRNNNNKM